MSRRFQVGDRVYFKKAVESTKIAKGRPGLVVSIHTLGSKPYVGLLIEGVEPQFVDADKAYYCYEDDLDPFPAISLSQHDDIDPRHIVIGNEETLWKEVVG